MSGNTWPLDDRLDVLQGTLNAFPGDPSNAMAMSVRVSPGEARKEIKRLEEDVERYKELARIGGAVKQARVMARMRKLLQDISNAPFKIRAIMRDNDLQIDDLDDPMQKLAFTVYTRLAAIASAAESILEGEE